MISEEQKNINKEPLGSSFFDDALDLFYNNINLNEELYTDIKKEYDNNTPSGFSLGSSKSRVDQAKVLSDIRSTSVSAVTALFNAKKSMAELELKKQSQKVDEERADNDKEYVRSIIEEIKKENKNNKINSDKVISSRDIVSMIDNSKKQKELELLEKNIDSNIENGSIQLTKNEQAMKYDFKNEVDIVYDQTSETVKAVKKDTTEELKDYPIERADIDKITRIQNGYAYSSNNKKIKVVDKTE